MKTRLYKNPPPYFIVLASSLKTKEVEFPRIYWAKFTHSVFARHTDCTVSYIVVSESGCRAYPVYQDNCLPHTSLKSIIFVTRAASQRQHYGRRWISSYHHRRRRPKVFDVGPTLYKCYTNVFCLLGYVSYSESQHHECEKFIYVREVYFLYIIICETVIFFSKHQRTTKRGGGGGGVTNWFVLDLNLSWKRS